MNFILPVRKPVNYTEIVHWEREWLDVYIRYKKFIEDMKIINVGFNEANLKWLDNYGEIPPNRPTEFYTCNIINSEIRCVLTLIRNTNDEAKRQFEVVKLNKIYLSNYDISNKNDLILYTQIDNNDDKKTKIKIDIEGINADMSIRNKRSEIISNNDLIVEYEETYFLLSDILKDENGIQTAIELEKEETKSDEDIYRINYEDSNWFSIMKIRDLLHRMRLKVNLYNDLPNPNEIPKVFLYNIHCMEIIDFDFTEDEEFKENLYDLINNKFEEMV